MAAHWSGSQVCCVFQTGSLNPHPLSTHFTDNKVSVLGVVQSYKLVCDKARIPTWVA